MSKTRQEQDLWRWPTVGLWIIFFGVGLVPERIFHTLRDLAQISTYDAALNSYQLITLALTTYLALFCYHRCREADLEEGIAQGKAIQIGALGLLAFLDVPFEQLADTRSPYHLFLLGIASAKMMAWLYLLSILVRHYFCGKNQVFSRMITLIPSAHPINSPQDNHNEFNNTESSAPRRQEADVVNQMGGKKSSSDTTSPENASTAVGQDEAM